jgi:hypothetical protein
MPVNTTGPTRSDKRHPARPQCAVRENTRSIKEDPTGRRPQLPPNRSRRPPQAKISSRIGGEKLRISPSRGRPAEMGCCSSRSSDSPAGRVTRWRSTGIVALRDARLKVLIAHRPPPFPMNLGPFLDSVRFAFMGHHRIPEFLTLRS